MLRDDILSFLSSIVEFKKSKLLHVKALYQQGLLFTHTNDNSFEDKIQEILDNMKALSDEIDIIDFDISREEDAICHAAGLSPDQLDTIWLKDRMLHEENSQLEGKIEELIEDLEIMMDQKIAAMESELKETARSLKDIEVTGRFLKKR